MTIPQTIIAQLGNQALAMLGAKDVMAGANFVQFAIRGSRKVNKVRITLDASDTYTVSFFKIKSFDVKTIAEQTDVYVDSLRSVIEANTGLYTSL